MYVWFGRESSEAEREAGRNHAAMTALARKRLLNNTAPPIDEAVQGEESEDFWDLLGGFGPIGIPRLNPKFRPQDC